MADYVRRRLVWGLGGKAIMKITLRELAELTTREQDQMLRFSRTILEREFASKRRKEVSRARDMMEKSDDEG